MTLPHAVDLRSNYERTYNQGPLAACGPFAVCAALDCIYERATGFAVRFDPLYLWYWVRVYRGMADTNTGSDFPSLERALRVTGVMRGADVVAGLELRKTQVQDTNYSQLKHLLAMGVPVVLEMKITADIYGLADDRDWRKHYLPPATGQILGQHYVCIVGYDDNVKRWLCENSWGDGWGDGGFFGIPYESLQSLTESLQHINKLPIIPKRIEGYSPMPAMLTAEKVAFFDRVGTHLFEHLMRSFDGVDAQPLINECVRWGVSDKHLEHIAGWPAGAVREFSINNPQYDWAGFIFDQI
ncbi:peptidase [Caudoviricetes sp.]|nr:peptidase [Caudoviricetes sp.]